MNPPAESSNSNRSASALPYPDNKPVGAGDFYFAINATFAFLHRKFGLNGLQRYWEALGQNYHAPVSARWRSGGLPAVAEYWRAFFAAEPGAEVEVKADPEEVAVEVRVCPAIQHLRAHRREILACFCQHCYFVGEAMAAGADLTMRVEGGNGACRQTFRRRDPALPLQNLARIKEAA